MNKDFYNHFRLIPRDNTIEIIGSILSGQTINIAGYRYIVELTTVQKSYKWVVELYMSGVYVTAFVSGHCLHESVIRLCSDFNDAPIGLQKACFFHILNKEIIDQYNVQAKVMNIRLVSKYDQDRIKSGLISLALCSKSTNSRTYVLFSIDGDLTKIANYITKNIEIDEKSKNKSIAIEYYIIRHITAGIHISQIEKNSVALMEEECAIMIPKCSANKAYEVSLKEDVVNIGKPYVLMRSNIYFITEYITASIDDIEEGIILIQDRSSANIFIYNNYQYGTYSHFHECGFDLAHLTNIFVSSGTRV